MSAKTSINALADTLGFTAKNFGDYVTNYQLNGTTNRQIRVNWTSNGGVYTAELTRNTSAQPDEVIVFTDSAKKIRVENMFRDVHATPLAPKKTTAKTTAKPTAAAPEPEHQCQQVAVDLGANGWLLQNSTNTAHSWARHGDIITLHCQGGNKIVFAEHLDSVRGIGRTLDRDIEGDLLARTTEWARQDTRPSPDPTKPARAATALSYIDQATEMKTPLDSMQLALIRTVVADAYTSEQAAAELRLAAYVADVRRTLGIATPNVHDWVKCEAAIIQQVREITATHDRLRHDQN